MAKIAKGVLIPIGGAEDKENDKAVLERFIKEIGSENPRIEIITAATGLPEEVGEDYTKAFESLGLKNFDIMDIRSPSEADDEDMIKRLEEAEGVFFTGGDQSRILETLSKTKFLELLKKRYQEEHFVIAGTSAGCAAMSGYMIMGGTVKGATHKGEIKLTTGLGFVEGVVFVTPYQYDEFEKANAREYEHIGGVAIEQINQRMHGTVGAVAIDSEGNLAAATSTGGIANCKEGRIGDSSMIGVGCFAKNDTLAISSTGDGELLIRGVICHSVDQIMRYKNTSLKKACEFVIHQENKNVKGDMGIIAIDKNGNVQMAFKAERMLRAWKEGDGQIVAKIY